MKEKLLPQKLDIATTTELARVILQDIWWVSRATSEHCLYAFVELFIFKYLSDLEVLRGKYNFDNLLKIYDQGSKDGNEDDSDNAILALKHYTDIIRPYLTELFPASSVDNTTIINGSILVKQKASLEYAKSFKVILRRIKNYGKLEHIELDFKSKLFESFLQESISKKNLGQYFTPIKVVRAINKMAKDELREGVMICDPACGVGKFPLEFISNDLERFFKVENGRVKQSIKIVGFDKGFEGEEQKTIILAKANMLIYFAKVIKDNIGLLKEENGKDNDNDKDNYNIEFIKELASIFNDSFILKTNSVLGTLAQTDEEKYDLILTNPPYVTTGSGKLKEEIAKNYSLKEYYKINSVGVEGVFVQWIIKALKKGGKAFIVLPCSVLNSKINKDLRQYILDNCYVEAIISLPKKIFATTDKKTYILALTKKKDVSELQTKPVFTYLVSEIGESRDIHRFHILQDDLTEMVDLYNAVKANNNQAITQATGDKRCKLQDISEFKADSNWLVERFFSKEEKIELGVEKRDARLISVNEFSNMIKDLSIMCNEFTQSQQER